MAVGSDNTSSSHPGNFFNKTTAGAYNPGAVDRVFNLLGYALVGHLRVDEIDVAVVNDPERTNIQQATVSAGAVLTL